MNVPQRAHLNSTADECAVDMTNNVILSQMFHTEDTHMLQSFLNSKGDPNYTFDNMTLLERALTRENLPAASLLLKSKAIPDRTSTGETPLFTAIRFGMLDIALLLISSKANIHNVTADKSTALHIAAASNDPTMISLVLAQNVPVHSLNNAGESALFVAVRQNKTMAADYLIRTCFPAPPREAPSPNVSPEYEPSQVASSVSSCISCAQSPLAPSTEIESATPSPQCPSRSCLSSASMSTVTPETNRQPPSPLSFGAPSTTSSVDSLDSWATPWHRTLPARSAEVSPAMAMYAPYLYHPPAPRPGPARKPRRRSSPTAPLLLRNVHGENLLTSAAMWDNVMAVSLLLAHRVPVDLQNTRAQTPLMVACRSGSYHVARLLLDAGASRSVMDGSKYNALMHATRSHQPDLVELLQTFEPQE